MPVTIPDILLAAGVTHPPGFIEENSLKLSELQCYLLFETVEQLILANEKLQILVDKPPAP